MKPAYKKLCVAFILLLVVVLLALLFVEHNRANKTGFTISIGVPQYDAEMEIQGVDYTNSPKISKETANHIVAGLLGAGPLPAADAPSTPPDAVMTIFTGYYGIGYSYAVWASEDGVIYKHGINNEETEYWTAVLYGDERSLFQAFATS